MEQVWNSATPKRIYPLSGCIERISLGIMIGGGQGDRMVHPVFVWTTIMRTWMFASRPFVGPLFLAEPLEDLLVLCQCPGLRSCHNGCREGRRKVILSSHPTGAKLSARCFLPRKNNSRHLTDHGPDLDRDTMNMRPSLPLEIE